jgi:EmrB/QacA subfamily drug resistance transporter
MAPVRPLSNRKARLSTVSQDQLNAAEEAGEPGVPGSRRQQALVVLAAVQFMLILDLAGVVVALPKIQVDLHLSHTGAAWVINGYVLMAGGFLLLGGRLSDMFGRRRLFLAGVLVFGAASLACATAVSPSMLVAGRFVQGTGEALASPAALGMIPVLFPDSQERVRALAVWFTITGIAGASGSVISGALTSVDWRWIFYLNIPVVVFAAYAVRRVLPESRMTREGHRIDLPGAVTVTGGLVAIVYGLLQAASYPWASRPVLLPLLGGVALLAVMVVVEIRSPEPLIPMRFFANRTRVTANVLSMVTWAVFTGYIVMLNMYLQQVLHYSPLRTGLLNLPVSVINAGIVLGTKLMPRFGVRPVMATGYLGGAAGLWIASYMHADSSYAGAVLPGIIVFGGFSGLCYPGLVSGALYQVTDQDAGLASGVQTAMQQLGAALGLAVLVTLALRCTQRMAQAGVLPAIAQTDGYVLAFRVSAAALAVAGVLVLAVLQEPQIRALSRIRARVVMSGAAARFNQAGAFPLGDRHNPPARLVEQVPELALGPFPALAEQEQHAHVAERAHVRRSVRWDNVFKNAQPRRLGSPPADRVQDAHGIRIRPVVQDGGKQVHICPRCGAEKIRIPQLASASG